MVKNKYIFVFEDLKLFVNNDMTNVTPLNDSNGKNEKLIVQYRLRIFENKLHFPRTFHYSKYKIRTSYDLAV